MRYIGENRLCKEEEELISRSGNSTFSKLIGGSGGPSIGYGKALGFFFSFYDTLHLPCRYASDELADGWRNRLLEYRYLLIRVEMG